MASGAVVWAGPSPIYENYSVVTNVHIVFNGCGSYTVTRTAGSR